jgi:dTDP-4-dehydrorhamnose reductase
VTISAQPPPRDEAGRSTAPVTSPHAASVPGLRIAVTGAGGQLGRDLLAELGPRHECHGFRHAELDVTDHAALSDRFADLEPDLVIHAAAYTDVDGCERDPDRAFGVNTIGTWNVAAAAYQVDAAIAVISSDFVFDGEKREPYTEFDAPNPISHYGASKRAAEQAALAANPRTYIIRTQWLYGVHGRNFPYAILRAASKGEVKVVADQYGAPTYSPDLARMIGRIIETPRYGIYHANNAGACNWYEFAVELYCLAGLDPAIIKPIPSTEWPTPTRRPAYSVLRRYALELMGLDDARPWQDAAREFIEAAQAAGKL